MYLEARGFDGDRVAGRLGPDVVALPLDKPLISQYTRIDKYLDHRLGWAMAGWLWKLFGGSDDDADASPDWERIRLFGDDGGGR